MAQTDFDPYAYAESQSETPPSSMSAPAKPFDPYAYASGNPQPKAQQEKPYKFDLLAPSNYEAMASNIGTNISGGGGAGGVGEQTLKSGVGAVAGGLRGLWDLAFGKSGEQASEDVEKTQQAKILSPQTEKEKAAATVASSPANPLNWPGIALDKTGAGLANISERMGAPAGVQTALRVAPTALAMGYGAYKGMKGGPEADTEGANATGFENESEGIGQPDKIDIHAPQEDMTPEQKKTVVNERDAILNRVGIRSIRNSATEANPKDAATDFQLSKTDTPAGNAAKAQFEHEMDAMTSKAQNIVEKTGGTTGLDEDALANRGTAIASPFDKLGQYFEQRIKELYAQARQRSGMLSNVENPQAITNLEGVEAKLNDPTFVNQLAAKNQGHLLNAVKSQLDFFRKQNPNGFTPATAEQFRQFLNQVWSPDNKWAIGQLVNATDEDVLGSAGEDIFKPARAMNILKKQTLENPNGIADLFSADPKTPMNRSTSYEKIPDTLMRLPVDQFENVLSTLKGMPKELQPDANAALSEIKAHFANKILQAGSETGRGVSRNLWNGDAVNTVLKRNSAKINMLFADDPEALQAIKDVQNAGNILKVDQSYPGAYAQEINLKGRGVTAKVLPIAGKAAGAATGGMFGGPVGAAGGSVAGSAAGETLATKLTEKGALKAWKSRIHTPEPP